MNTEPLSAEPRQVDGALRARLSEISAAVQLLQRRASEEDRPYLAAASRAACRAVRVLNERELARRLEDEDELRAVFATMDLVDWCRGAAEHADELLAAADLAVKFQADRTALVTLADQELLEQLLYALLSNAAKAAKAARPGGTLTVTLAARGKRAVLTVGDEGAGMAEETIARLFQEPDGSVALSPESGAGFGLRLARTIAEVHGGVLVLENTPGTGVRAAVSLPIREGCRTGLESPRLGDDGFDRALVALSDVLPAGAFDGRH